MSIKLEDLKTYKIAVEMGDIIYHPVATWDYFDRGTLGKQLVPSADAIALPISEGYGRFFFKENKIFCHYSRLLLRKHSPA